MRCGFLPEKQPKPASKRYENPAGKPDRQRETMPATGSEDDEGWIPVRTHDAKAGGAAFRATLARNMPQACFTRATKSDTEVSGMARTWFHPVSGE